MAAPSLSSEKFNGSTPTNSRCPSPSLSLAASLAPLLHLHIRAPQTVIRPELAAVPAQRTVAAGESASFECLPVAWPEPSISWRRGDQPIKPGETRLADGSPKYVVNRIARAESAALVGQANGDATAASQPQQVVDRFGSQLVIRQVDREEEDGSEYSCVVETKGTHQVIERQSRPSRLFVKGKYSS